jgi:hypothetical protein
LQLNTLTVVGGGHVRVFDLSRRRLLAEAREFGAVKRAWVEVDKLTLHSEWESALIMLPWGTAQPLPRKTRREPALRFTQLCQFACSAPIISACASSSRLAVFRTHSSRGYYGGNNIRLFVIDTASNFSSHKNCPLEAAQTLLGRVVGSPVSPRPVHTSKPVVLTPNTNSQNESTQRDKIVSRQAKKKALMKARDQSKRSAKSERSINRKNKSGW